MAGADLKELSSALTPGKLALCTNTVQVLQPWS